MLSCFTADFRSTTALPLRRRLGFRPATALAIALVFGLFSFAGADQSELLPVTDLATDAAMAKKSDLVLLIEFSSEDCQFCYLLEDEFLRPMLRNREYHKKVIIREAALYEDIVIKGFDGKPVSIDQFASRYDVKVTPTMVFLDAEGNQLSEPLVGIWSLDYFGGHIDKRIDQARDRLLSAVSEQ